MGLELLKARDAQSSMPCGFSSILQALGVGLSMRSMTLRPMHPLSYQQRARAVPVLSLIFPTTVIAKKRTPEGTLLSQPKARLNTRARVMRMMPTSSVSSSQRLVHEREPQDHRFHKSHSGSSISRQSRPTDLKKGENGCITECDKPACQMGPRSLSPCGTR